MALRNAGALGACAAVIPASATTTTRANAAPAMTKLVVNWLSWGSAGMPFGSGMVFDASSEVMTALATALPTEREMELMPLAMPDWW